MLVRLKTVVLIKEPIHLASWVSVFDYVLRMVQRELSSDPRCILVSAEIKLPLPQNMKLQMSVASQTGRYEKQTQVSKAAHTQSRMTGQSFIYREISFWSVRLRRKNICQTEQNEKIQLDPVLDHSQHGGRNTIASRCIGGGKAWKVLNVRAVILVCSGTPYLVHNRLTEVNFLPQQDHNPKRSSKLCKSH